MICGGCRSVLISLADSDRQAAACSAAKCDIRFSGCGAVNSVLTTLPCSVTISTGTSPAPLLEQQPRRRLCRQRRQHEGGADIGMARERKLPVHA